VRGGALAAPRPSRPRRAACGRGPAPHRVAAERRGTAARTARAAAAALAALLVAAAVAPAVATEPSLQIGPAPRPAPVTPGPRPALDSAQVRRLREAAALRERGRIAEARALLQRLNAEAPHQPGVVLELARCMIAREDWPGTERFARFERAAARDSLLLSRELVLALERLARHRDMAQVAIEAWAASPVEQDWAIGVLERAAAGDARAPRELLRRAAQARPDRADLARHLARLEWRGGDPRVGLRALAAAERAQGRQRLRWSFAEELLAARAPRDTSGAIDVLLDLAADPAVEAAYRTAAAKRAWDALAARAAERDAAPRVAKALAGVPPARWSPDLRLGVARALRDAGRTGEARAVLEPGPGAPEPAGFALERALADLRDGPPERALPALRRLADETPEAAARYAEALFYAGHTDSAHAWFQRAAADPAAPGAGAALERLYLLEEEGPPAALATLGRIAYEEWRGDRPRAEALADSLWRALPEGPLWAHTAVTLAQLRAAGPAPAAALEPLLAVAERHPEDRLAPLARQLAGDLYLNRLKDEASALAQYEECLARYPRAWNAPEVRRRLETLRRDRRL